MIRDSAVEAKTCPELNVNPEVQKRRTVQHRILPGWTHKISESEETST
jgi:hypothetical protein